MGDSIDFFVPDCDEFRRGYQAYNQYEKRGPFYFQALSSTQESWGNPRKMAEGVETIIRTWNRFYAHFSLEDLTECIKNNLHFLTEFKDKHIFEISENDNEQIKKVFKQFLIATQRENDQQQSAVSVAKAFAVLAPHSLPLWDSTIAWRYNCLYINETAAIQYLVFIKKIQYLAKKVKDCVPKQDDRSLLKRIDEYNFAKYTANWI
jgi:hypothetical protein